MYAIGWDIYKHSSHYLGKYVTNVNDVLNYDCIGT